MAEPQDPHEIDLAILFPSLSADKRIAMRDLLDSYCDVAFRVFTRLEREDPAALDPPQSTS